MHKDELQKLRGKVTEDLLKDRQSDQDALWQLKLDLTRGKVKNVKEIHKLKRRIAVINTILKEKNN